MHDGNPMLRIGTFRSFLLFMALWPVTPSFRRFWEYLWKLLCCKMCTFNTAPVRHQSHLCTKSHRFTRIKVSAAYLTNHRYIFEPFELSQTMASPRDCCDAGGLALFYRVRRRNAAWRHLSLWSRPSRATSPNQTQQPGRWWEQDVTATPFTGLVILKR